MEINEQKLERKVYATPQLTVYGAIEQLTTGGTGSVNEASGMSMSKKA